MSVDPSRPHRTPSDRDATEEQPGLAGPRPSAPEAPTLYDADAHPPASAPPCAVPGYRDWHFLGSGTFGEVWRATQDGTTITVAIKFFVRYVSGVETEVRRLAQLAHSPGVVRLESYHVAGPVPFLVMEYADGGSLAARMPAADGREPLALEQALAFFREIAEALAYVHSKGILHCDLKPANVLLDSRDKVRLADFGQAQLVSDLKPSLGTFFFMAPEQARLGPLAPDTRWDVYALGAILYQMLTGQLPRHDEELARTLAKTAALPERLATYRERIASRPRPSAHRKARGVDRDLADVVDRCLELDPERRFADAGAVLAALRQRERRRKQRPMLAFGIVGPLLLMSLILALSSWQTKDAVDDARDKAAGQRLASNEDVARIVASALRRNLRARLDRVGEASRAAGLAQAVRAKDQGALEALLDRELLLDARGKPGDLFTSAWVTDTTGRVLGIKQAERLDGRLSHTVALRPKEDVHVTHEQFTWRDWFSGGGDRADKEARYAMIDAAHVSDPYVTVVKGIGTVVAVSVPIPAERGPVGLLSASVQISALGEWLRGAALLSDGGRILLLNRERDGKRGLLMDNGEVVVPKAGEERPMPPMSGEAGRLGELTDGEGTTYLAGFARPEAGSESKLDWVVLVRHEKEEALAAIEELRERTWRFRLLTYGLTAAGMAGLWVWLFRLMRRQGPLKA